MNLKTIAVLGPGGTVGSAIITELLKEPSRFNIIAITRPTSTYTPPPNITHRTADYTTLTSITTALTGADAVVNCITGSATQYEPTKLIIDATVTAKVPFYFANEFVGHVTSPQYRRLPEALVGAKLRIREYLAHLAATGKVTWTALNGGPFFDLWLMKGPGGFDVRNRHARIYGSGSNPLFWTPLPVAATAVGNMLRAPRAVANRAVYICPFVGGQVAVTQNRLAIALETVIGGKFTRETVDVAQINARARLALERGQAAMAVKGLAVSNQFFEDDCGNDFSHLVENDVVGVQTMSLEEAVRDAVERFGRDCEAVQSFFRVEPCEL